MGTSATQFPPPSPRAVALAPGQLVGLDSTTLAALEQITATLNADQMTALLNAIAAAKTTTVALDALTLAALEAITVQNTVPVSGTFWPAVQPVSGSVTTTPAAGSSVSSQARIGQVQLSDGTWTDVLSAVGSATIAIGLLGPTTSATIVSGAAGKKIHVLEIVLACPTSATISLRSNTTEIWAGQAPSNVSGLAWGRCVTNAGDPLTFTATLLSVFTVALTVKVTVRYVLV